LCYNKEIFGKEVRLPVKNLLVVALLSAVLFGAVAGVSTAAECSLGQDVITASDAGGGDLTNKDIGIIFLCIAAVALVLILLL